MVVKFFRVTIKDTDKDKLISIKNWLEPKIDRSDLHDTIGDGNVYVVDDIESSNNYNLVANLYINPLNSLTKYLNLIKDKFLTLDKSTLISAKIIKNDNCSHDEDIRESDVTTDIFEWQS